jgi:hypothetical protein
MSVSTEVQRTLVKSPPELWAELSNPEALARHLADLGEIRITAVEPETKVEWEAEGASGIVHLKQSGWGTKVTLSLTRDTPASQAPAPGPVEPEPESIAVVETKPDTETIAVVEAKPDMEPIAMAQAEPDVETIAAVETKPDVEPIAVVEPETDIELDPEPIAAVRPETVAEPVVVVEPEPLAVKQPEPRRRFFARLFRRRNPSQIAPEEPIEAEPESIAVVEPEPEIEIVALAAPEPIYPAFPPAIGGPCLGDSSVQPMADLAAELEAVEAQMAQETTELLTGVLDRLGAAHHRPFSRG